MHACTIKGTNWKTFPLSACTLEASPGSSIARYLIQTRSARWLGPTIAHGSSPQHLSGCLATLHSLRSRPSADPSLTCSGTCTTHTRSKILHILMSSMHEACCPGPCLDHGSPAGPMHGAKQKRTLAPMRGLPTTPCIESWAITCRVECQGTVLGPLCEEVLYK